MNIAFFLWLEKFRLRYQRTIYFFYFHFMFFVSLLFASVAYTSSLIFGIHSSCTTVSNVCSQKSTVIENFSLTFFLHFEFLLNDYQNNSLVQQLNQNYTVDLFSCTYVIHSCVCSLYSSNIYSFIIFNSTQITCETCNANQMFFFARYTFMLDVHLLFTLFCFSRRIYFLFFWMCECVSLFSCPRRRRRIAHRIHFQEFFPLFLFLFFVAIKYYAHAKRNCITQKRQFNLICIWYVCA